MTVSTAAGMVLTGSSPWGLFGSFLDKQKGTFVLCIEKGDAEKNHLTGFPMRWFKNKT